MNTKVFTAVGCALLAFSPLASVRADEAKAEGGGAEMDEAIAYVEALVDNGYPDFAKPIIEDTRKKWPDSDARLFAIDVRGMLSLGQFEEANKLIASLPDRKSTKYWAARLEVAMNYYARNQKDECKKIYGEFFKVFPSRPKGIEQFWWDSSFTYGQLLVQDGDLAGAAARYEEMLKIAKGDDWCQLATETSKIYLKLADDAGKGKGEAHLKSAEKIVDKLLWYNDQPMFFGQAVSMKAHIYEIRGNYKKAVDIISEYRPQLQTLHDQIIEYDPDGSKGFIKFSALPECLYLQAKILWQEAQTEYKKSKRDDEKVKSSMFGEKGKNGKRNGQGAFPLAYNVFIKYDSSPWAISAGELAEEVRTFAEEKYKAKINTKISKEQLAKMRVRQFKSANDLFLIDKYQEAIDAYREVLAKYPEMEESVDAVSRMITCYVNLWFEEKNPKEKEGLRLYADAVENYVAERFCGNKDRKIMIAGGNATVSAAALEQERGNVARADELYKAFYTNYRAHPNAANIAASRAALAQKAENWEEALGHWGMIVKGYTNSTQYVSALSQMAYCYGKLNDTDNQIKYINRYLPLETVQIRKLQAQFQLAQMYQKTGLEILNNAETNSTPEAVAAAEKAGSAKIIHAIKEFNSFSDVAEKAIADKATTKVDREKYKELREAALFMAGECYSRINRPEKAKETMRVKAAESFEKYVEQYPEGKYVKTAYVKLGTIYTAMGDLQKSRVALDRLSKAFPDSDEAKNAMPRLAKNLIEMGMKREGTDIYGQMLRTDGKYTALQYLSAGDALIDAKSWDLANQAFEKAGRMAQKDNQSSIVAKARLGQARTCFKQGSLVEAREALDQFLGDQKMSKMAIAADAYFLLVDVASEQGRTEKDDALRTKYFNAAIGALKKVRGYWKNKPREEQDGLDLQSAEIQLRRVEAEEAMGLKEQAMETRRQAAGKYKVFIQSHGARDAQEFAALTDGAKKNFETAIVKGCELFSGIRDENGQADIWALKDVRKFGNQYLEFFPNGKFRTQVLNMVNQAAAEIPADADKEDEATAASEEEQGEEPAAPAAEEVPAE